MRVDLQSIDREQFMVHEHVVAGETLYLVQPQHIGAKWDASNLIYRSSLWTASGEPVSLSWRKHHNWEEAPDIDPAPTDLSGVELMEKIDGSTLLISRFKDTVIVRTRGTVDATKMDNGDEIALFKERYPKLFECRYSGPISGPLHAFTAVCEWVSPRNQIVVPYSEPDLYLTGIITHDDYSYVEQDLLDRIAVTLGIKRPRRYAFNTIPEMLAAVTAFKGVEGVCVYYNRGQSWRKCKAAIYLALHRFKERVTVPNLLDLFFAYGRPDLVAFLSQLERDFDHECMEMAKEIANLIYCAHLKVKVKVEEIEEGVADHLVDLPSRREQAMAIQMAYSDLYRGVAFKLLDKREIDDKMLRKLIEHELGL